MQWPLCRLRGFSPSRTAARTLGYVFDVAEKYPHFMQFAEWLNTRVLPALAMDEQP